MLLELILAYGLLVGAIVGMDHVLPGYEGDQFLALSRGQVPRYLNSREIMSGLEQLEPDISTSETISGLASDMRPSMDNGHNLDQSVEEQEDKTKRDPGKKVVDKGGNDSQVQKSLSLTNSKGSYDVFQDEGSDEYDVGYEKWAK